MGKSFAWIKLLRSLFYSEMEMSHFFILHKNSASSPGWEKKSNFFVARSLHIIGLV